MPVCVILQHSVANQTITTDFYSLIHLYDSPHGFMISQTILSDLTPIMSDSHASNSKHEISWIADLQTTVYTVSAASDARIIDMIENVFRDRSHE